MSEIRADYLKDKDGGNTTTVSAIAKISGTVTTASIPVFGSATNTFVNGYSVAGTITSASTSIPTSKAVNDAIASVGFDAVYGSLNNFDTSYNANSASVYYTLTYLYLTGEYSDGVVINENNGTIEVPVDGTYIINAKASFRASTATYVYMQIAINGTGQSITESIDRNDTNYHAMSTQAIFDLSAEDKISIEQKSVDACTVTWNKVGLQLYRIE